MIKYIHIILCFFLEHKEGGFIEESRSSAVISGYYICNRCNEKVYTGRWTPEKQKEEDAYYKRHFDSKGRPNNNKWN